MTTDFLAPHETETYRYDAAIPATARLVPDGVDENGQPKQQWVPSSFMEKYEVDAEEAAKIWVRLRVPMSRRDISVITNAEIAENSPMDAKRAQFLHLADAWSFGSGQPKADVYDQLMLPVWDWLDACVQDVIRRGVTGYEKKESSPKKPRSSRASSTPA